MLHPPYYLFPMEKLKWCKNKMIANVTQRKKTIIGGRSFSNHIQGR